MCFDLNRNAIDIYKVSKMPLFVLLISIILYIISNGNNLIKTTSLALFSGSIFYFLTSSINIFNQKRISKKFSIERYTAIKFEMVTRLLSITHSSYDYNNLKNEINNYVHIRSLFQNGFKREISEKFDLILIKQTLHNLNQFKELLSLLMSYDFVKGNDKLSRRIYFLNLWIDELYHSFDLHMEKDGLDFYKIFDRDIIDVFVLGFDQSCGSKKIDDFVNLIMEA